MAKAQLPTKLASLAGRGAAKVRQVSKLAKAVTLLVAGSLTIGLGGFYGPEVAEEASAKATAPRKPETKSAFW